MTKTELKHQAQNRLMSAMQAAFDHLSDEELTDELRKAINGEMDRQMRRVERFFGYDENSWTRGV